MSRRNASRRSNKSTGKPAWVWFVLGNFVGGFVVFMIFLNGLDSERKPSAAGSRSAPAEQQAEDKSERPRFDFYTLLKENEVAVPPPKTKQIARRSDTSTSTSKSSSGGSSGSGESWRSQSAGSEPQMVYILQAASFRDASEAEKLRAQLMLANMEVSVEKASDSRGTWHRVLVGPYTTRSRMANARETLAEHRLMPLVLKRPAKP